jgi:hypothetical protein
MAILKIGIQFSDDPAGRFYTDGDGNGEEFREEVLKPILESYIPKGKKLSINIDDNVEGYGSSFLVEAFGGLVRNGYFKSDDVMGAIEIECSSEDFLFYKRKIMKYIKEAKYNSMKYNSTREEALNSGIFKNVIDKSFVKQIIEGS